MYCNKCGQQISEGQQFCPSCGAPSAQPCSTYQQPQDAYQPVKPDNYMVLAIFTTVCCCLPLGIVAIIKASGVNSAYALRQYDLAQLKSDEAKKWSLIGIGISVVCNLIYFALMFLGILAPLAF